MTNQPIACIPISLLGQFTMGGRVQILYSYHNDTRSEPLVYTSQQIDVTLARVAAGQFGHYGGIDEWLYRALTQHPVTNQTVAIIGSADQGFGPWYECICLHYGGKPITIEYNPVRFEDRRIRALTPQTYAHHPFPFDAAFSISSFEHDGLGRYGDPINPDGDLETMREMKKMVRPGGLLFLSVPMGIDKVVFNEHRIYGRIRLPLLLDGWTIVETYGFHEALLDRDTGYGWTPKKGFVAGSYTTNELMHPDYPEYGPIFVLHNDDQDDR